MLPTICEDYTIEWFGSLGAVALNTVHDTTMLVASICATPVCFWSGDTNTNDASSILTALNCVHRLRTIAPEDFMTLYELFAEMQPTQPSLRAVLSYFGGTSTILFLPQIFSVSLLDIQERHHMAERLFVAHFERIFSSGTPEPVLLRLFLSMAQFQSVDVAFIHKVAKASVPYKQNMQAFLQSDKLDPNYCPFPGDYEGCLLVVACRGGHADVVEVLLQYSSLQITIAALLAADAHGHLPIVLRVLEHIYTLQYVDDPGLVRLACAHGHTRLVVRFIDSGSIYVKRADVLSVACANGQTGVVALLLPPERRVRRRVYNAMLSIAARKGHVGIVRVLLLLTRVTGEEETVGNYYTVMEEASRGGHCEIVSLFLRDSSYVCNHALVLASRNGHTMVVKQLLANGRFTSFSLYASALEEACTYGREDCVRLLLSDSRMVDVNRLPYALLCAHGRIEILRLLRQYQCCTHMLRNPNDMSRTPIVAAPCHP